MPDRNTFIRINLYKKNPQPSRADSLLAQYERELASHRSVVRWADWHSPLFEGPSEYIVEQTLTFAQCIKVANAPPIMVVEGGYLHYSNPDTWSEDEERVLMVNGYPYQANAEGQRVALLRRSAKRIKEESRKKSRLKLLKQYTRRIKHG